MSTCKSSTALWSLKLVRFTRNAICINQSDGWCIKFEYISLCCVQKINTYVCVTQIYVRIYIYKYRKLCSSGDMGRRFIYLRYVHNWTLMLKGHNVENHLLVTWTIMQTMFIDIGFSSVAVWRHQQISVVYRLNSTLYIYGYLVSLTKSLVRIYI